MTKLFGTLDGPALQPDDVVRVAYHCAAALRQVPDGVWRATAAGLEWSCDYTLRHTSRALDGYAIRLALRTTDVINLPRRAPEYPETPAEELLTLLTGRAAVLARLAEAAPPEVRVFHNYGNGDPVGMTGMGCVELLAHTDDITRAAGLSFVPPADLCGRVVRRMFPWAPADAAPWDAFRWATGRFDLPDRPRLAPDWIWLSAPLAEWDGTLLTEPPG